MNYLCAALAVAMNTGIGGKHDMFILFAGDTVYALLLPYSKQNKV